MAHTDSIDDVNNLPPTRREDAFPNGKTDAKISSLMEGAAEANSDRTGASDEPGEIDTAEHTEGAEAAATPIAGFLWKRILGFGALPALALILAIAAAILKWQTVSTQASLEAGAQSTQAAKETTVAMLSYRPDTAVNDLPAAANGMTGKFRDSYLQLINDVVIPGAEQKKISSVATVPAAAAVSATEDHAVVMLFINQTINFGDDGPTDTASSVRATLVKVQDRWLMSQFDPI